MLRLVLLVFVLGVCAAPRVQADTAPAVVADIAPVHALVARVMEGVGEPGLILPQDASPHGYAMRPSQAARLQEAGLVVWMGPGLTPWLSDATAKLAPNAPQVILLEVEGTVVLPIRDDEGFLDHANGHDHSHGHDHGDQEMDPHAWLDPQNAGVWMKAIAVALAQIDPENAELYMTNAEAGQAETVRLTQEIAALLASGSGAPYVVSHDALHYFEARFDRHADGAVTASDAAAAGAAHLAELRDHMQAEGIRCLLVEPGLPTDRLGSIFGENLRFAEADILGRNQQLGAALYPGMLRAIAQNLIRCTTP